jgi:hypothetical protein
LSCGVDNPDERRAFLQRQLEALDEQVWAEIRQRAAVGRWGLGRFRFRIGSARISTLFAAFHLACFVVGVTLITVGGTAKTIGIAVVVGALFAFGSFIAQLWAVSVQHELSVTNAAYKESREAMWHELAVKREAVVKRIKALDSSQ